MVLLFFGSSVIFGGYNLPSEIEYRDGSMVCRFFFDEPVLSDMLVDGRVFTQVFMDDCFCSGDVGDPALPVFSASILIPEGEVVKKIHVSHGPGVMVDYDFVGKPVVPNQREYPFSRVPVDLSLEINESLYGSSGPVFDGFYEIGGSGYCRGYEILTVDLYPVDYRPNGGVLFYYPEMTVTVDFEKDARVGGGNRFLRYSENDVEFIGSIVANPNVVSSYDSGRLGDGGGDDGGGGSSPLGDIPFDYSGGLCDSGDTFHFVIITNDDLKDTVGNYNWSDLVDHRLSFSGLSGTVVTVEDIVACTDYWNDTATFNDTQARIREFCKDAYQDWGTEYIVLGGDWDSTASHQIVPYRLFTDVEELDVYDTMACDKYYSHLDGDWYYDAQSVWGGGRSGDNDLYGELYVGRITAYNASMVSNAVNKIINYDTNSSLSDSWLNTTSFWGGDLGWTSTAKQYMEEIRLGTDTHRTFTGFEEWNSANPSSLINTSERLYHADLGANYKTYHAASLENDNASIVNHLDHTSWNTPFALPNWQFRYNTKPFFGYSQGCLAGRFHSGYAGCEQMMCRHHERHAYALVLNTGYGYGSSTNTNGASQYINAYFWDYFFNNQSDNRDNWQFGKAFSYASDKMGAIFGSKSHAWVYAYYSAHFFGDPAQTLRIGEVNNAPVFSNENPGDESINVSKDISTLNVTIQDAEGDSFNWSIETNPNIGSNSANSEGNGSKSCVVSGLDYNTTYYWYVNATDGNLSCNATYSFTTAEELINNSPVFSGVSIANGSTDLELDVSLLSLTIEDAEGDSFNWSIETSPNVGSNSSNNEFNGTKNCSISGLIYSTTYYWYVNASDSGSDNSTNASYYFSTRDMYTSDAPGGFSAVVDGRFEIDLSWVDDSEADVTRVEWHTIEDPGWNVGDHNLLYNGSAGVVSHSGLSPGTTRYYKAWSYNATDKTWSSGSTSNNTTDSNLVPVFGVPSPANESGGQELSLTWGISVSDGDGDLFNWTIECNNGESSSANEAGNGTKELSISGLVYDTTYKVWVNVTDSYGWAREWYNFTTRSEYSPSPPSGFSASKFNRTVIDLSWSHGSNSDKVYIRYNTGGYPADRGSGIFLCNETGTSKSVTGLSFGTTYYFRAWAWNDTDSCWSGSTSDDSATTDSNNPPVFASPNPVNGSTNQDRSLIWSISISDSDGDTFNWSIECSNGQSNGDNYDADGSKQLVINGLSYSTEYFVWVNATDSYGWSREWYNFSTGPVPPNNSPSFSGVSPGNGSTGVSISRSSVSVAIRDAEGDGFNWSIVTSPDIGTSSGVNASNGSKSCSISGLGYSTTYYWFVSAYDTGSCNWSNMTYNFKTESEPYVPPGGPSGGGNDPPVADAGGPYSGFVNESIVFDGSGSSDEDGVIESYSWVFGDGSVGSGVSVSHSFSSVGEFTVVLTVVDDGGDESSDGTTVTIVDLPDEPDEDNDTDDEPGGSNETVVDDDSDGIPDDVEEDLGLDTNSSVGVSNVTINGSVHYLVDTDGDGSVDVYYNPLSKNYSSVKRSSDGRVLIDVDGDDTPDYFYDEATRSLSSYVEGSAEVKETREEPLQLWMVFVGVAIVVIVLLFLFWRHRNQVLLDYMAQMDRRRRSSKGKKSVKSGSTRKVSSVKKMESRFYEIQDYYEKVSEDVKPEVPLDVSVKVDRLILSRRPEFFDDFETGWVDRSSEVEKRVDELILDSIRSKVDKLWSMRKP